MLYLDVLFGVYVQLLVSVLQLLLLIALIHVLVVDLCCRLDASSVWGPPCTGSGSADEPGSQYRPRGVTD